MVVWEYESESVGLNDLNFGTVCKPSRHQHATYFTAENAEIAELVK